jgi:hypothetical protein
MKANCDLKTIWKRQCWVDTQLNPVSWLKYRAHTVNTDGLSIAEPVQYIHRQLTPFLLLYGSGLTYRMKKQKWEKCLWFSDLPGMHWDDHGPFLVLVGLSRIAESKMPACLLQIVTSELDLQIHFDTCKYINESVM